MRHASIFVLGDLVSRNTAQWLLCHIIIIMLSGVERERLDQNLLPHQIVVFLVRFEPFEIVNLGDDDRTRSLPLAGDRSG